MWSQDCLQYRDPLAHFGQQTPQFAHVLRVDACAVHLLWHFEVLIGDQHLVPQQEARGQPNSA